MNINNERQLSNIDKLSNEYKLDKGKVRINWGRMLHCTSSIGLGIYVVYKAENISVKGVALGLGIVFATKIVSMGSDNENKTKRK